MAHLPALAHCGPASGIHLDNIATPGAPVWRRRIRKPFTCRAVRMQILAQAADLPEADRQLYVRRRLTALDKALTNDEAEALERWLDCEELLQGRAKISSYGASTGGGRGSLIPDWAIEMLTAHASNQKRLIAFHRRALNILGLMMSSREWDFGHAGMTLFAALPYSRAKRRYVRAVADAAAVLAQEKACQIIFNHD